MKRRKSKKIDKIHSPSDLYKRICLWHDVKKGKQPKPDAPEPLEPSELTRVQQIQLIEYLKYSEALSNVEISDFLKIHRVTVGRRLDELDERQALELEEKGFNVWRVIHRLKMTVGYVKRLAAKKGDGYLYLRAELAFIDQCQKLGIVFEKPQEIKIQYPIYSEADERLIIKHLRSIERQALNPASSDREEGEIIETIPKVSEQ